MKETNYEIHSITIGEYAKKHHIPKTNNTISKAALIDQKRDLYLSSKNYKRISSLVFKVRFAPKKPKEKNLGYNQKIGINKKVLNDYVNIVNRRKYLVDQIEENVEEM